MIVCVTAVKRNLISRFVAIKLVTELSRYFFLLLFNFQSIRLLILQLHLLLFCSTFRGLDFTDPALI